MIIFLIFFYLNLNWFVLWWVSLTWLNFLNTFVSQYDELYIFFSYESQRSKGHMKTFNLCCCSCWTIENRSCLTEKKVRRKNLWDFLYLIRFSITAFSSFFNYWEIFFLWIIWYAHLNHLTTFFRVNLTAKCQTIYLSIYIHSILRSRACALSVLSSFLR